MSYWEKLLSVSAPEATSWPPGFAECANKPSTPRPSAEIATTQTFVRLPSVASGRRQSSIPHLRSISQRSEDEPGSIEPLSVDTRPWSDFRSNADISPTNRGDHAGTATSNNSQRETRSWCGGRLRRGSKEMSIERETQRKELLSESGHSLMDEDSTACSSSTTQYVRQSLLGQGQEGVLEGPGGGVYVDFVGRGGARTSTGTSEKQWQNQPDPAFPIVAPPFVTDGEMGQFTSMVSMSTSAAGSTSAPSHRREPRASHSLPPLGGGETACSASPEGAEAKSAPARVEGCGGMGQGLRNKDCASRGVILRALEEGVRRSPGRVARLSGLSQRVVSGEGGRIPSYGKRKAFHNFVYRRQNGDAPKRRVLLGPATTRGGDSSTCSMGGTAASSTTAAQEGDGKTKFIPRRRQGWEACPEQWNRPPPGSVQPKRACDTATYRTTSGASNSDDARSTTTNAFTTVSYSHGGGSKPSCCGEGRHGRPLKCHRCGSARIKLFTAAASASTSGPSSTQNGDSPGSSTHGSHHRRARGGDDTTSNIASRSSLILPILGTENVRGADPGASRWTRTEETSPAVASPQEVSGDAVGGPGGVGVRRSRQNAAGLGGWKRRGRYRG